MVHPRFNFDFVLLFHVAVSLKAFNSHCILSPSLITKQTVCTPGTTLKESGSFCFAISAGIFVRVERFKAQSDACTTRERFDNCSTVLYSSGQAPKNAAPLFIRL